MVYQTGWGQCPSQRIVDKTSRRIMRTRAVFELTFLETSVFGIIVNDANRRASIIGLRRRSGGILFRSSGSLLVESVMIELLINATDQGERDYLKIVRPEKIEAVDQPESLQAGMRAGASVPRRRTASPALLRVRTDRR